MKHKPSWQTVHEVNLGTAGVLFDVIGRDGTASVKQVTQNPSAFNLVCL